MEEPEGVLSSDIKSSGVQQHEKQKSGADNPSRESSIVRKKTVLPSRRRLLVCRVVLVGTHFVSPAITGTF